MAIIKSIELENGITVSYHRVVSVNNITNVSSIIEVGSYTNKAKREEEKQAMIEAEIKEMEDLLLTAIVLNKKEIDVSKVNVGTIVKLYDEEFDEEVEYSIVGTQESDPKKFVISNESPLGASLLGHKVGDFVVVTTPNGESRYKILSIRV